MKHRRFLKTGLASLLVLVLAFSFWGFNRDQKNFEIAKNLDIYYTLFRELNLFYVDEIDPGKLVKESIDDMLASLDPYTVYIPESEMEDFNFMTTGEYAGIGALISKHGGEIVVAEPYEGFPAQKSGLKAGDIFLEVDGKKTSDMKVSDVSELLKGPANKPIHLKMQRPGQKKPYEVDIVRENIQINPVPYYGMLDDSTGYIRLSSFTANCGVDVKNALLDLRNNKHAKQLVFDLRGNPGGLLVEAVKIANLFVNQGQEIVSTRGKVAQWDKTYRATEEPVDTIMPMVILVNRGSASASEIVTGSMQDLDRAVIMGTRTFGKGLVQTTRDLSYNSKLKVTTAKYYIPSGRCIQALDYAHRNPDGSVGTIPDSLISKFSTKDGRTVFDGGGISPDVKIDQDQLSNMVVQLIQQFMVFDFATQFVNDHPSIAAPGEFQITDDIYNNFKNYVKEHHFTYESKSEQALQDLIETAKKEKYYDGAAEAFKTLHADLSHNIDQDMNRFSSDIKDLLRDEIVSRYYYQKGAIKASMGDDKDIEAAVKLLHNPAKYRSLLAPNNVISAMK